MENALKILEEKPSGFKALEKFEKTGRTITKTRLNFTIDITLAGKFRECCKKNGINMPELVENLIKKKLKAS